jgi:predicted transposase YbfD/YdcC
MASLIRRTEDGGGAARSAGADLLSSLSALTDPRQRRGIRHGIAPLVAVAASAVLAGARSFTAIGEWVADASQEVLAALGIRFNRRRGRRVPPDEATLRRALRSVDADEVDRLFAMFLAARRAEQELGDGTLVAVALDGKTVRGARIHADPDSRAPHLVSAVTHHDGVVLGQVQVDEKSNEITAVRPLLGDVDLAGVVVTADAMHTQTAFAQWLIEVKQAHYLFMVKANQPALYQQIQDALTGPDTAFTKRSAIQTNRGHGRIETRTIRVTDANEISFPHAAQVFRLRRDRAGLDGVRTSKEIAYGITSLSGELAGPAQLTTLTRGHWTIENRLHHVRDVTWGEDHSQVRTGNTPRVMAGLRNLATSVLRQIGSGSIAKSLRHNARSYNRPLKLLGINTIATE